MSRQVALLAVLAGAVMVFLIATGRCPCSKRIMAALGPIVSRAPAPGVPGPVGNDPNDVYAAAIVPKFSDWGF